MGTNITGIGNANAIGFKSRVTGGIYFPPELKDALVGVWSAYGKSNDSTDRNIIKNKIKDRGGDFVISNAAFKLNSGFGKYEVDFTTWSKRNVLTSNNDNSFSFESKVSSSLLYYSTTIGVDTPSFKIKANISNCLVYYYYINDKGTLSSISILDSGEFELPISHNTLYNGNIGIGFEIGRINGTGTGTITQIPSYQGAFVTDGINDLITSTKTVQEMLGGSNEITVVSMMANLDSRQILCNSNYSNTNGYNVRNTLEPNGVISILGYTDKNGTTNNLDLIMGDKNSIKLTDKVNFNSDYVFYPAQYYKGYYQVAWYWTIIANKVLTTDQINQVIAYFNLDRTLKPDILCNTIKQGITNENHAEFGDKLIDFSGNGRDIQLNNIAWDGNSGIGKYNYPNWKVTATIANTYSTIVNYPTVNGTYSINVNGVSELMQSIGLHLEIKYTTSTGIIYNDIKQDGVYSYILPDGATNLTLRFGGIPGIVNEPCNITITQIPSHAGALCLDGVNDFGKVTGLPIYKDYTVIADYERTDIGNIEGVGTSPVLSKSYTARQGSFIMNFIASTGNSIRSYSFGTENTSNFNDLARQIFYQSKYKNQGFDITAGTGVNGDSLWLGTARDNDSRFFNGAIYSLMSFPYSMSKFLIERQLKKYKLGTLYPDMVEFRPVIKVNDNYKIFYTAMLPLTGDIWERINIGDYVPVGRRIAIQMSFDNEAKKLVSAVSSQLGNITIVKNSNNIGYTIFGDVLKDKSPQKISITIEQDENYVLFNPIINSNYKYISLDFFLNNYQKKINIGDYIPKDAYLRANLYLNNNVDEPAEFTFNGVSIGYSRSITVDTAFNIGHIYNYDSPQEVNITIDEYIRYEDIVQPYPVLLRFNDESGKEVSWGGKFRVGSTITRIGSAADSNLLPNIYNIFGLLLNGNQVTSSKVIVEKTMVFKAKSAYIFDNNEPKVILSPRLLRIPNSSYKILGHIPDISGHGNHGKINNSAYAEGSGVNEDGSYQFDGVDDFVTIPTLFSGGKQVLMKVNSLNSDVNVIYDQRLPTNMKGTFAIMCDNNLAYSSWNTGQTYIDGILNKNIIGNQLVNITHNLTITNDGVTNNNSKSPFIGKSTDTEKHANMSLYDFMLFDKISTDDKIKELNEYVGIEAKVELPPYYWDAYGKSNTDEDKATIQQRGVAVGDYDLTNYNHAYEGMSGYNGYPIILSGNNKSYQDISFYVNVVGDDKNVINLTRILFNTAATYSYVKKNGELTSYNKAVESFKIKVTGIDYSRFVIKYSYISEANATAKTTMTIASDNIYELPKSFASDGSLTSSDVWIGIYFTKQSNDIPNIIEDVNVTIEVLPEYENGLVYDGITDYSKNANILALDDFTAIIKREWLKKQGCPLIKGSKVYEGGNGNALLLEWDKAYNFVFYKRTDIMEGELPDNISFITPTNYNGNVITRGSEQDTNGICIAGDGNAGFANMVFYKLILYPKTIPLLQINFLKNLMEKDEIIDLNNPIFIKNE